MSQFSRCERHLWRQIHIDHSEHAPIISWIGPLSSFLTVRWAPTTLYPAMSPTETNKLVTVVTINFLNIYSKYTERELKLNKFVYANLLAYRTCAQYIRFFR